ncbi:ERCC4 domain-containing protein [uncultured Thiodictyon sp.]|uniref:ERCC4 domain-containing protein n=1 Tax=uncultured Thiodictyon sp. TaxID=1846217 RepID=UPI0025FC1AFF|nr:ERCC4 domain-containing protein [uncultured Thiodictyon sp.]
MAASQTVCVVVDDRESAGAVLAALRGHEGIETRVARLPLGDYLVDDAWLFERKTLPDLVASIKDGRLFAQGLRLAQAPLRTAVILEGSTRDLAECRMRREAIQGALVALTLFLGIPLLRSLDPAETARLMLFAARQGRAFAAGSLPRKGRRPRGKARVQSRILQGLPGIGPARAKRLLERFGTIESVMAAPADELAEVPGIGQETAAAIRWAVAEATATYDLADLSS